MAEFKKYPKIKHLGDEDVSDIFSEPDDEIVIEEKMDGANFRFAIVDNRLIFGTRNCLIDEDQGNKMFNKSVEYVKEKLKPVDLKKYNNYIFYGENMVRHTLDYDWIRTPPVLMFDIFDLKTGQFVNYDQKTKIFKELDLVQVPLVIMTTSKKVVSLYVSEIAKETSPSILVKQSKYGDFQAEGVVFKNYEKQMFAKYVREQFKEQNKLTFGGSKKYATNDDSRITLEYCTNARIEKIIFKLIDEGNKLEMKLMEKLPKQVYLDIWEEHFKDIIKSNYVVDFRKLRKLITKRCLNVLKKVIAINMTGRLRDRVE